jgi:hypothetical protein
MLQVGDPLDRTRHADPRHASPCACSDAPITRNSHIKRRKETCFPWISSPRMSSWKPRHVATGTGHWKDNALRMMAKLPPRACPRSQDAGQPAGDGIPDLTIQAPLSSRAQRLLLFSLVGQGNPQLPLIQPGQGAPQSPTLRCSA